MDSTKIKLKLFFWYSFLWIFLFVALYLGYFVYFVDTTSTKSKWVGLFAGVISILFAFCKICEISFCAYKNQEIEKIIKTLKEKTILFLRTQTLFLLLFSFLISLILYIPMGIAFVSCFFCGAVASLILLNGVNLISILSNAKAKHLLKNNHKEVYGKRYKKQH